MVETGVCQRSDPVERRSINPCQLVRSAAADGSGVPGGILHGSPRERLSDRNRRSVDLAPKVTLGQVGKRKKGSRGILVRRSGTSASFVSEPVGNF